MGQLVRLEQIALTIESNRPNLAYFLDMESTTDRLGEIDRHCQSVLAAHALGRGILGQHPFPLTMDDLHAVEHFLTAHEVRTMPLSDAAQLQAHRTCMEPYPDRHRDYAVCHLAFLLRLKGWMEMVEQHERYRSTLEVPGRLHGLIEAALKDLQQQRLQQEAVVERALASPVFALSTPELSAWFMAARMLTLQFVFHVVKTLFPAGMGEHDRVTFQPFTPPSLEGESPLVRPLRVTKH